MTRWVLVAALLLFSPGHVQSQSTGAEPTLLTVTGEIVDAVCYSKDRENRGADHRDCTWACARKGQPLALVTTDGDVYHITGPLVANKNAMLLDYVSKHVTVQGTMSEADGKRGFSASSIAVSEGRIGRKTIRGEVFELGCYMKDRNKTGEQHKDCAMDCVEKGARVAILSEGWLYELVPAAVSRRDIVAHVASDAQVTGQVQVSNGTLKMNVDAMAKAPGGTPKADAR